MSSSSVLNKRIILDMEAKKCSDDEQLEQEDEEEVTDCSPPVKKTFLGVSGLLEVNDDVNRAATADISTCEIGQVTTSRPVDPDGNGVLKQRTKLWMKPGGSNKSPRVGSDFQAMIE
jgi:hypothetical protein